MCRSTSVVVGEVQDEATESVHQEAGDRQQPLRVRAGTPESKPSKLNTILNKKRPQFRCISKTGLFPSYFIINIYAKTYL